MKTNSQKTKTLEAESLFKHFTSIEHTKEAQAFFKKTTFPKQTHLLEAQSLCDDVFFISSGLVRFYYLTIEGKEFNKSFATTGEVVGSLSTILHNKSSPFFIEALENTVCWIIAKNDLLYLSENFKDWNQFIFRLLADVEQRKEEREADFLLLNATQQYEKFIQKFSKIVKMIPDYHIASYLGITHVALSRIQGRLELT